MVKYLEMPDGVQIEFDDDATPDMMKSIGNRYASRKPAFQDGIMAQEAPQPESSYGEVFQKSAQNAIPATKSGFGGVLQAISATPGIGIKNIAEADEPYTGVKDALKKGVQGMVGRVQLLSSALPALLSPDGAEITKEAQAELAANQPNVPKGSLKDYVGQATTSVAQNIPFIAGSILTRNPALALGQAGTLGFGQSYNEQTAAGQSPEDAFLPALGSGAAEIVMEKLPLGILMKEGGSLFGRALKSVGAEGATEAITQFTQDGIKKGTISPNMTLGEMLSNARDAGIVGSIAGGAMGVVAHPFSRGTQDSAPLANPEANIPPIPEEELMTGNAEGIINPAAPMQQAPVTPEMPEQESEQIQAIEAPIENASPILSLVSALNAVNSKNLSDVSKESLTSAIDNGYVDFDDNSDLQLTETGSRLLNAIQSPSQEPAFNRESLEKINEPISSFLHINPQTGAAVNVSDRGAFINSQKLASAQKAANTKLASQKPINEEVKNESPVRLSEGSRSDTDTVFEALTAIENGDDVNSLKSDVIGDLLDNGIVEIGKQGFPEITPTGKKLFTEIQNGMNSGFVDAFDNQVETQEVAQQPSNPINPLEEISLPQNPTTEDFSAVQNEGNLPIGEQLPTTQEEAATPQEENDLLNYQAEKGADGIPYEYSTQGVENSPEVKTKAAEFQQKFDQKKAEYTKQLVDIVKKINPSVKTEVVNELFGEGEALLKSGASSSERQQVAGVFDKVNNLIKLSLNTLDPKDAAYHESFHSVQKMLEDSDQKTLSDHFKGDDSFSPNEQMAIAFANYALKKNGTGIPAHIRRIFDKLKQILREIGRTMKLGDFKSIQEDLDKVFSKVESGQVYQGHIGKIRDAIQNSNTDVASLLSNDKYTPEEVQQAVLSISPELHDVIYNNQELDTNDELALAEIVAEESNSPEARMYSIGKQLFDPKVKFNKDKVYGSIYKLLSPIMSEKQRKQYIEDWETNIRNTTKEAKEPSKMDGVNAVELAARNLVQSNDGALRFVADKLDSPTMHKIADMFYHGAGHAKSVAQTYFEAIDDYVRINMNKIARGLEGMSEADQNKVVDMLQNPDKDYKYSDKIKNAVKIIGDTINNQRRYLEEAGFPIVQELKGYFPRVYDVAKIVANPQQFMEAAKKAYAVSFTKELKEEYANKSKKIDALKERQQQYLKNVRKNPNYGTQKTAAGTEYYKLFDKRAKQIKELEELLNSTDEKTFIANTIEEKANRWKENILLQDQIGAFANAKDDFHPLSDLPPAPDESKSRILAKEADEILRDFMVRNPIEVMGASIMRAAKAAEFNRRFGDGKWDELKAQMNEEGAGEEGIRQVIEAIKANTGMMNSPRGKLRDAIGAARYYSNITFLPRSAFSSIPEAFTVATKTGNPIDGLRTMVDGFKAAFNAKSTQGMLDTAEMLGIIGEIADEITMAQRVGGDFENKKRSYLTQKYFRMIGLSQLTRGQMAAVTKTAQFAIGKWSQHIANNHNRKKSSEFMISELGIPKDKIEAFSKWVNDNGGKKVANELILDNSEMAKLYRNAIRRFVNTTIQVPTAATRQRYASTPVGAFAFGLSSYINAFSKNVLIRNLSTLNEASLAIPNAAYQGAKAAGNLARFDLSAAKKNIANAKEGIAENKAKGYTAADRAAFAMQTMMLVPLMLLAGLTRELRDEIFSLGQAKPKKGTDKGLYYLSAGSLFGSYDAIVNMFTGLKYQRDPLTTFSGPLPATIATAIKAAANFGLHNSANTNTQERQLAQNVYSLGVAPLVTSFLSSAPIGPLKVPAAIAIQAINSKAAKEKFTDSTAGKKRQ